MKYLIFILLLIFSNYFPVWAQETKLIITEKNITEYKNSIIEKIIIHGNNNTKNSVIKNCLNIKEGDFFSTFDYKQTIQSLYKTGLFKSIDIYFIARQKEKIALHVKVNEKITFIPIPMLIYSKGDYTCGLLIMEANLLGYNKKLMAGGFYSNKGWNSIIMLEDPGQNKNSLIYKLLYKLGQNEIENTDFNDTHVYQRYNILENQGSVDLGYKFLYNNKIYLKNGIRNSKIDEDYEDNVMPPESTFYYFSGVNYTFENMNHSKHFKTGFESRLEYIHGFSLKEQNNDFDQIKLHALYQLNPWIDHITSFRINAGTGDLPATIEERIGGKDCFKSLPGKKIAADHYIGSSLGYEIPFYSNSTFVFTNIIFYEAGWHKRIDIDDNYYHGIGNGLRMYLKKVAIPAVGIDFAYNIRSKNYEFTAYIGFKK